MEKVYIGKVVNTHGIKGEIRILSDFAYKEKAFKVGTLIEIENQTYKIMTYRRHKNFEMITLEGLHDINEVLPLMKKKVYKEKKDLQLSQNEILDSDLIHYQVVDKTGKCGIIKEIFYASSKNKILRVFFDKEVLIPLYSPMVVKVDTMQEKIEVDLIDGMM